MGCLITELIITASFERRADHSATGIGERVTGRCREERIHTTEDGDGSHQCGRSQT